MFDLPHLVTDKLIEGIGHGEVEAQGKAMDILEAIKGNFTTVARDEIRAEAFEEAARIVEGFCTAPGFGGSPHPNTALVGAARAIRAAAKEQDQ